MPTKPTKKQKEAERERLADLSDQRRETAVTADDVAAKRALLVALGFDPDQHSVRTRIVRESLGLVVVRADGTIADWFTYKDLKAKQDNPLFLERYNKAREAEGVIIDA